MAFPDFMGTFFMCPTVHFFLTLGGPIAAAVALGSVGIVLIDDILSEGIPYVGVGCKSVFPLSGFLIIWHCWLGQFPQFTNGECRTL